MNWYKSNKSKKIIKTAKKFNYEEKGSDFQNTWKFNFGDYQRWVVDAFDIQVYLTKLSNKCIISLHVFNWHNGIMRYQEFWKYGVDEENRCKNTFEKIVNACKELIEEMTEEEDEPQPNSIVVSQLRAKVWQIDRERLPRTNIPSINYYYEKAQPVSDWRESIYGKRYPKNPSSGY